MRPVLVLVVLAACGFDVPGTGGNGPGGDAGPGGAGADASPDGSGATASSDAAVDGASPIDAAGCPNDYVVVPAAGTGHVYKAHGKLDQGTALAACALEGGHLLRLDSQAEADALVAFIDDATTSSDSGQYRVIGARDRLSTPNAWRDTDLSALTFLPWEPNEPHDGLFVDCMLLEQHGNSGELVASDCSGFHEFACECE